MIQADGVSEPEIKIAIICFRLYLGVCDTWNSISDTCLEYIWHVVLSRRSRLRPTLTITTISPEFLAADSRAQPSLELSTSFGLDSMKKMLSSPRVTSWMSCSSILPSHSIFFSRSHFTSDFASQVSWALDISANTDETERILSQKYFILTQRDSGGTEGCDQDHNTTTGNILTTPHTVFTSSAIYTCYWPCGAGLWMELRCNPQTQTVWIIADRFSTSIRWEMLSVWLLYKYRP